MKRIEDIKEFKDIDTYYEISKIVDEVFQDRVEAHKHLVTANKEIERLNNIKQDLLYVLSQLDGYLDKGWTIDLNFTDIREKYKKDIEDYENWN